MSFDQNADKPAHPSPTAESKMVVEKSIIHEESQQPSKTAKFIVGIVLVILVAFSKVAATQFASSTYSNDFNAPFFVSWFNASALIICYPVYCLCALLNCKSKTGISEAFRKAEKVFGTNGLTFRNFMFYGGAFSFLALGTNYVYLRALGVAAASDVTALFAANAAFVFVLSCVVLKTSFISFKIVCVLLAIAGIVLFASADGFTGPTAVGVSLTIVSALGATCYTVTFKKVVGQATPDQVCLFLSVTAAFTLIFYWPILLILHLTNTEVVTPELIPWTYMGGGACLRVSFEFFTNFGVAYTYPLFITFGNIVAVPLNYGADIVFRGLVYDGEKSVYKISGSVLIICAFVVMVLLPAELDTKLQTWLRIKRSSSKPKHKQEVGSLSWKKTGDVSVTIQDAHPPKARCGYR